MVKKYKGNSYNTLSQSMSGGVSSSTSVILYRRSSEVSPLLPGRAKRRGMSACQLLAAGGSILTLSLLLFTAVVTTMHFVSCPPDPSTRDAIRQDWEREESQHVVLEHEWRRKTEEQYEKEQGWKRDIERHEREVARSIQEERRRQERVRQEWMREVERHVRDFEELQRREREERDRDRERWRREVAERERRLEEERQRLNMFWGHVEAHTCTTYATREYTAQLVNLPASWTWTHRLEACRAIPLEVHGISHLPSTCEDRGQGVVIGRWQIDQGEPDCTTFWDSYNDKGCSSPGSGKKYITHKLENLPENSDWREFCATTPAYFNNMQFPGAQECFTSIWGVYGQWEMYDANC